MDDDWPTCDAETAVAALSARYRFSLANAVQLLRDQGILRPHAGHDDDDDVEEAEGWGSEEEEDNEEEQEDGIIPMPGQDLVSVGAMVVGPGGCGFQDGAAAGARFCSVYAMLCMPDGRVLVADLGSHRIRMLSADLQQVSTLAGDGVAAPAACPAPAGHRDGAAAQAQFRNPGGLALLADERVLVADGNNHRIRVLSADLQQVSTVAGDGEDGHRDGAASQAQFRYARGLAVLTDGRVLVADVGNHRIRVLSADLQQVSTVAGDGGLGHRDGAAAQAQFHNPMCLALLPDGRVLVADCANGHIRVLSADLQQVSTLTNVGELSPKSLELLPDGRLLVSTAANRIRVLEGFPAAVLSTKPSHKPPKKTKQQLQQEKKKRALAGGARSTGRLVPKRSRSGTSSSSSMAAPSSSDSEGEEQPGGSAAEAEPLV
jgi:Lon protease-like protein